MDEKRVTVSGGRVVITEAGVSIMSSRECVYSVVAEEIARDPKALIMYTDALLTAVSDGVNGLKMKIRTNRLGKF